MPPMNPKGPTMALQDLKNWFADKGLRITHAATLARFEKQLYDHKDNTITPVEASEKESWQWQSISRWGGGPIAICSAPGTVCVPSIKVWALRSQSRPSG